MKYSKWVFPVFFSCCCLWGGFLSADGEGTGANQETLFPQRVEQRGYSPEDGSTFYWYEAIGTHFRPDPEHRRVGAIRVYPAKGLGLDIFTEDGDMAFDGPLSERARRANFEGLDVAMEELADSAPTIDTLIWSMSPAKGSPDNLTETVEDYQDAAYAHALYALSRPRPRIYLQAGNEVNGFFFNPTSIEPVDKRDFYQNHFNSKAQAERYVQWGFAPFVEAVLLAREETGEGASALPLILGSVTAATNPDSVEFLDAVLETRIDSPFAPDLQGLMVSDVADIIAVHYMMNCGPHGLNWRENMDHLYQKWLEPDILQGIWLTEEGGTANKGAGDAAVVLARFFSWWADKDWSPLRGRLFFWSDWAASEGLPIAYQELFWGEFFRKEPFQDVSGSLRWIGSGNLEGHAFATTPDSTACRGLIILFAEDYSPGYKSLPEDAFVGDVTQPLAVSEDSSLRTAAYVFDTVDGFRRLDDVTAQGGPAGVTWTIDQGLPSATRPVLLLFADATPEISAGPIFDGPMNAHIRGTRRDDGSMLIDLEYSTGFSPHVEGGLDDGRSGDDASLVANRRNAFSPEVTVTLPEGLEGAKRVRVLAGLQGGLSRLKRYGEELDKDDQTWVAIYWDDHCLFRSTGRSYSQLETVEAIVENTGDWFKPGEHQLRLESSSDFFACQLDALSIAPID